MSEITSCQECGAEILEPSKGCPSCARNKEAQTSKLKQDSDKKLEFISGAVVIAIFTLIVASCISKDGDEEKAFSSADALLMCQMAFKKMALDPDKADVPYVKDFGKGGESYFAWGASTKMMRMRNGLGMDVATSGACFVDHATRRITGMTLNGKDVF